MIMLIVHHCHNDDQSSVAATVHTVDIGCLHTDLQGSTPLWLSLLASAGSAAAVALELVALAMDSKSMS